MTDSLEDEEKRRWLLETIRVFLDRVDPGYMRLNPGTEKFAKDLCYEYWTAGFLSHAEDTALAEALIADAPLLESIYRSVQESIPLTHQQLSGFLTLVSPPIVERWLVRHWAPGHIHGAPITFVPQTLKDIWS